MESKMKGTCVEVQQQSPAFCKVCIFNTLNPLNCILARNGLLKIGFQLIIMTAASKSFLIQCNLRTSTT